MNTRMVGAVAGFIVLLLFSIGLTSYNHLQKENDDQVSQINTLNTKLLVVTALLNSKMSNFNLDATISIALSKNVKPADLIMAIKNIQKNPANAQEYLTQLNFNQDEIQTSLTAPAPSSLITNQTQNNKPKRHYMH